MSPEAKKATAEERDAALHKKITEEIKARKAINDDILEAAREQQLATNADNEARHRRLHEERKQAIANIEAETARLNDQQRQTGLKASQQRQALTDEEWVANLPEHHLQGYVAVDDDV